MGSQVSSPPPERPAVPAAPPITATAAGAATPRDVRVRGWIAAAVAIAVVVALFGLVTWARGASVGVELRDPGGRMFRMKLGNALLGFAGLTILDVLVRTLRAGWSRAELRRQALTRWDVRRLGLLAGGLVAYHLVYFWYRNLKSWDAFNTPRDDDLLAVDRWLFFGHDPSELLHQLLGQGTVMATFLAVVYEAFPKLISLAVIAAPAFVTHSRRGLVTSAAGMWAWILGVGSYYLIPSLGPIYSAPEDFTGLAPTVITDNQVNYWQDRAAFLADPTNPDTFSSISAFASLHVALSTLLFLLAIYYRQRWLAWPLGAFVCLTMVATIYFGWHFFVDLPAGVLIACLALALGHLTVYPPARLVGRPRRGRRR